MEQGGRGASVVRQEGELDPAWPAAVPGTDETAMMPIPPGGDSGGQAEAGADEQPPPVEELVNRLPPEVRTVLEELFRAKWTEVKRLRPEDLQS